MNCLPKSIFLRVFYILEYLSFETHEVIILQLHVNVYYGRVLQYVYVTFKALKAFTCRSFDVFIRVKH